MIIKIVTLIIFMVSMFKTIEVGSVFFNKGRKLNEKGHKWFGIFLTLLTISGIQLFNVFDFIKYIAK